MRQAIILKHQSLYMQAPLLHPELRYFLLVAGYGAGKTRANVIALMYAVKRLQGKKDRAGDGARLMVAGYTLAHLNTTLLLYLRQYLNESKTPYFENKKDNYIVIGTVTILVVPLENPGNLFGKECWAVFGDELDELPEDKTVEAIRALSERCRQQIVGERDPFIALASTSQGQKGLYRVYTHFKKRGVGFALIRGRTEDNIFLPKSTINDMKRMYTADERRVFMEGEFLSIAKGKVFGDFAWERNYLDYDLDNRLQPDETVMVAMDFNCVAKGSLVYTLRGDVPIEDITTDDFVLTRKGYRRVLRTLRRGVQTVYYCAGVYTTRDHVYITPEGDREQWQIGSSGSVYYLPKHASSRVRLERMAELGASQAKELSLTGLSTTDTRNEERARPQSILSTTKGIKCSMLRFTSSIPAAMFQEGVLYIIYMALTIIGLKHLCVLLTRRIRRCTQGTGTPKTQRWHTETQRKRMKPLKRGTTASKVSHTTARCLNLAGMMGDTQLQRLVDGAESLSRALERAYTARSVRERLEKSRSGCTTKNEVWREDAIGYNSAYANSAERPLRERQLASIAGSIKAIGVGGKRPPRKAEVYDIEIEDVHEYFVNGVLVHNCGFSRASAYIVREGVIYGIKDYDFPNAQDAASVFRHDFPEQRILWIPDVTIKDSFPQFARELRRYGIQIIYRKKNPLVEDTVFLVNKLLYTGRLQFCKIAKNVAEACALAMRDKDNKIPKGVGPGSPIHYCLTGSTKILTSRGWKRLRRVAVGDAVLTRNGWRYVVDVWCTGKRQVRYLGLLGITGDHRVWTEENKMRPRDTLTGNDTLITIDMKESLIRCVTTQLEDLLPEYTRRLSRPFGGMRESGIDTRKQSRGATEDTFVEERDICISLFGKALMAMFLLVSTYIMRTGSLPTMLLRILLLLAKSSIEVLHAASAKRNCEILTRCDRSPPNGTGARMDGNGTASTVKPYGNAYGQKLLLRCARCAALILQLLREMQEKASFAPIGARVKVDEILAWTMLNAPANTVAKCLRRIRIVACDFVHSAARIKTEQKVYSLSVDDTHEFFADGILVANCDTVRYAASFICMRDRNFRDIRRLILDKRASFRSDSGKPIQDLGDGYVQIHPDALYKGKRL
jgi:hypothetical protein